jgi:hypothetical protein
LNQALWLLMRLQLRGRFRSLFRVLGTPKGAILGLVGALVCGLWLLAVAMTPRADSAIDPDTLRRNAPAFILGYCVLMVITSRGEWGFHFSPAEVEFLFTGPFTRRQLLVYKIFTNTIIALATAALMTAFFRVHAAWAFAAYLGLFLGISFLQLFTMAIGLVAITIGTQAQTRIRRLVLVLLGILTAVLLFRASQHSGRGGFTALFQQLEGTQGWKTVTAPLSWFIETFLVQPFDWLALAKWGGMSAGVALLLVLLVLLMDTQYLESAASASERVYNQIQRMRRGEAVSLLWGSAATARWGLPSFPFWGGAGPIAWRQATTAIRSLGRLALVALVFIPVMIGPLFTQGNEENSLTMFLAVAGLLMWLSMLLTTLIPFDFRADLDRMDVLKTLPLPAWRLVFGQLLAPILIMYIIQASCLVAFWLALDFANWAVLSGLCFAVPLNVLLFGLDNLLFLWFPSRMFATRPGDFTALGRNVLILLTKMMVLGCAAVAAGALGFFTWWVSGSLSAKADSLSGTVDSPLIAGLIVAWIVLAVFAVAVIPLAAVAFRNFDVSRDMPA